MRATLPVLLKEQTTSQKVQATLIVGVTLNEVDEAVGLWAPFLKSQSPTTLAGVQHAHWDWSKKARAIRGLANYAILGVEVQGEMQALMLWDDLHSQAKHPSQLGRDLVYIHFLSTAPWNDLGVVAEPKFRGAGTLLIRTAVERSLDLEYKGRVGLHSLCQAEPFYRDKCKMIDLGKDAAHENLCYFEFTPPLAEEFLKTVGEKP